MKITKVYINNFKGYRRFTLHVNDVLNVITGRNNSGKTTMLEAISLWNECFRFLIVEAKKGVKRLSLRQGDYRLGNKHQNYIDYREISSVRSHKFSDIFFELFEDSEIEIGLFFQHGKEEKNINFIIRAASGNNYEVKLKNHDAFDFSWLNSSFNNLPESIGCYFASPVAAISVGEEFALDQKIRGKVTSRQSFIYIRNRIHRLSQKPAYAEFKEGVSYILNGEHESFDIQIVGDINVDINIDVNVSIGVGSRSKELSLLGSGTLQIIELLLASFEESKDLNVILLDEPDSHIHRDIQKRLIEVLVQRAVNTQIFLTTHNESLIRSVSPEYIFNISDSVSDNNETNLWPVTTTSLPKKQYGINTSHHNVVLQSLGSESSLDLINAIDADKLIFVEGADDSEYIGRILKLYSVDKHCVYWSFRGLDTLIKKISHYQDFLSGIGANQSIWEKSLIVVDADFMTDNQKTILENKFVKNLGIPAHIWRSYTLESTILDSSVNLSALIIKQYQIIGLDRTQEDIEQAILTSRDEMIQQKLSMLATDLAYREKITKQIQNRAKALSNDLGFTKIFKGGEVMFFQNFDMFAKQELEKGRLDHLCDKDDVEAIINNIFEELGCCVVGYGGTRFNSISNLCDKFTGSSDWKRLVNIINN